MKKGHVQTVSENILSYVRGLLSPTQTQEDVLFMFFSSSRVAQLSRALMKTLQPGRGSLKVLLVRLNIHRDIYSLLDVGVLASNRKCNQVFLTKFFLAAVFMS